MELLTAEKSLCESKQKIIISKDHGSQRIHRAVNPRQKYNVRQYKLDGDIFKNQKCCDFLVLNDTNRNAYLVELKGGNIDAAVPQIEAGEKLCKPMLPGYQFFYRIVCSKVRTHDVQKNSFRKFKDKCGSRLVYSSSCIEETLR